MASSLIPKGPRRTNASKEQANVPFVPEENAWDSMDETCAQGRAPPQPPDSGEAGGAAPSPPSLAWAADWLRLHSQGQGLSDSSPALPGRVLPEHSTSLTSAATRDPPAAGHRAARLPEPLHLPPRPPALALSRHLSWELARSRLPEASACPHGGREEARLCAEAWGNHFVEQRTPSGSQGSRWCEGCRGTSSSAKLGKTRKAKGTVVRRVQVGQSGVGAVKVSSPSSGVLVEIWFRREKKEKKALSARVGVGAQKRVDWPQRHNEGSDSDETFKESQRFEPQLNPL